MRPAADRRCALSIRAPIRRCRQRKRKAHEHRGDRRPYRRNRFARRHVARAFRGRVKMEQDWTFYFAQLAHQELLAEGKPTTEPEVTPGKPASGYYRTRAND